MGIDQKKWYRAEQTSKQKEINDVQIHFLQEFSTCECITWFFFLDASKMKWFQFHLSNLLR